MQTIYATARSDASPQTVWGLLADVDTWPRWAAFDSAELERPGKPDPQGVDAIRRFKRGRYTTRERVTAFEPPRRFGYELLAASLLGLSRRGDARARRGRNADHLAVELPRQVPDPRQPRPARLQTFIADTVEGLAVPQREPE